MKKKKPNTETPIVELFTLYGSVFLLFIFWLQRLEHRGGGFVLESKVVGQARLVIWPPTRWQPLDSYSFKELN